MSPENRVNRTTLLILFFALLAPLLHAQSADDAVGAYLRGRDMGSLLEVQLESRLSRASDALERAELSEQLAQLYLSQLREIDATDPYRQVVVIRAKSLLTRVSAAPMFDLRLELLINEYSTNENAIELHRLGLLGDTKRAEAEKTLKETRRELSIIKGKLEPELDRLTRRRAQRMGTDEAIELASQIEFIRRQHSLSAYYLGWSGYGLAVLENRHLEDGTYIAFAWLLGAEGGMPQQSEIRQAALEYEHVARSAIGIAMCYAQSENYLLAESWLQALHESESISVEVRDAVESRMLQVLATAREWYETHRYALEITRQRDDEYLPVADARFIAMQALDSRVNGAPGKGGEDQANKVAQLGIEHLIEQGEIGHVVDLYQRYESLPMLRAGFITNYARALSSLNRAEEGGQASSYLDIAQQFVEAVKSHDASDYPTHQEDCRLKLAYTLVRADRSVDAIEYCDRVINSSLRDEAIEEARWLKIAAYDRQNVLKRKQSSPELDDAVRAYVESYPSSQRTAKLVLRHAMRGTLDEQLAIDTLSTIGDEDPIAIPARQTLVQLQYQMLRSSGFTDQALLARTRSLIDWLVGHFSTTSGNQSTARSEMAILRIGIDLALRDTPPDSQRALALIELAQSKLPSTPSFADYESELLVRRVQISLIEDQIGLALASIDELRQLDPEQAEYAEVLTLNELIERWENNRSMSDAELLIDFGIAVLARMTPKAPESIGVQTSTLIELIADSADMLGESRSDPELTSLAMRLLKQVLERGAPSEPGLRRTARLADGLDDQETQLTVWLRLLAAYPQDDARWFEARYESLKAMMSIDIKRAFDTFAQFKVLNPTLGPAPWNQRIADLFNEPIPDASGASGGRAP